MATVITGDQIHPDIRAITPLVIKVFPYIWGIISL
jgi:hypothetical protein